MNLLEHTEGQEERLENFLMTGLNEALENNCVDRDNLTLFENPCHTRLIKFFATSFFESYISKISIENKMDNQEQNVEFQDSYSAVSDHFT